MPETLGGAPEGTPSMASPGRSVSSATLRPFRAAAGAHASVVRPSAHSRFQGGGAEKDGRSGGPWAPAPAFAPPVSGPHQTQPARPGPPRVLRGPGSGDRAVVAGERRDPPCAAPGPLLSGNGGVKGVSSVEKKGL